VGKLAGKGAIERPKRVWEDNIKINIKEIGWDGVDYVAVAQSSGKWRAVVNTVINLVGSSTCGEFVDQVRNCKIPKKNSVL
jgi:hypothetical protein